MNFLKFAKKMKNKLTVLEKLQKIAEKYSNLTYNKENYFIGGGLSSESFSSKRHEDAKNDAGKLTIGNAVALFKKATEEESEYIKNLINFKFKDLEWHHAGKLPRAYGGGMKKTYFLNAEQITTFANAFFEIKKDYEAYLLKKQQNKKIEEKERKKEQSYLKKMATYRTGIPEKQMPKYFHITFEYMNGKFGTFEANRIYNLPVYVNGYEFKSKKALEKYQQMTLEHYKNKLSRE